MHGRHLAALAAALGLMLAACSGGGGAGNMARNGGPNTGTPTPAPAPQTPTDPAPQTPTDPTPQTPTDPTASTPPLTYTGSLRNRAAGGDPEKTFQSVQRAAGTQPRFGSVTQATDAASVTALATTDLQWLRVTVERQGKDRIILDSRDSWKTSGSNTPASTMRDWSTVSGDGTGVTISQLSARLRRAHRFLPEHLQGLRLARGYYLHIAGENLISSAPTVTNVEMGAFADGLDYRTQPEHLPSRGTAYYSGPASGFAVFRYGGDARHPVAGADWQGTATLTANFGPSAPNGLDSISGCIGCAGNITFSNRFSPDGVPFRTDLASASTRINLGRAFINADGTFRASDVTLSGSAMTASSGSWGGKFSYQLYSRLTRPIGAQSSFPPEHASQSAAGTVGGRAAWRDGSTAAYVGSFESQAVGRCSACPSPR